MTVGCRLLHLAVRVQDRLLVVSIIWIGAGILTSILHAFTNAVYTAHTLTESGIPIPVDNVDDITNTLNELLAVIVLIVAFQLERKAASIWRKVQNFADYSAVTESEIEQLSLISRRISEY